MTQKSLVIRDDIHGDITVPRELTDIISHELFQRLRGVGQTGLLYLVYPSMRHSRFEHSIGTMHLALQWYCSLKSVFSDENVRDKFYAIRSNLPSTDGSVLKIEETANLWSSIVEEKTWELILSAAALLHDVGHGPFSHSIEQYGMMSLDKAIDFTSSNEIKDFLKDREIEHKSEIEKPHQKQNKKKLTNHEDFSVVLADYILGETVFFKNEKNWRLYVCALINKDFRKHLLKKVENYTEEQRKLLLLSPLISGLFDVDRMDYMQRDSSRAGVNYGLVETQRLMIALVPTLAEKDNALDVYLVTKARYIHSLDHFLVGLFQLHTTLYMHPSYEGYQYELGLLMELIKSQGFLLTINNYAQATDAWLSEKLNLVGNSQVFNQLISRKFKDGRKSFQTYSKKTVESVKFSLISGAERETIKDGIKLWLIDSLPNETTELMPWDEYSLVARNLKSVKHTPSIWWKNSALETRLAEIKKQITAPNKLAASNKS